MCLWMGMRVRAGFCSWGYEIRYEIGSWKSSAQGVGASNIPLSDARLKIRAILESVHCRMV